MRGILMGLADHTVQVWVEEEERDEHRRVVRTYRKWGGPARAAVQVASRALAERPGGEAESGNWRVYMDPQAYPPGQAKGVIQILAGPEAPRTLRVVNPYRPRGKFLQAACVDWEGDLNG